MFVPTRSSILKQKTEDSCQTIVFKSKKNQKLPIVDDSIIKNKSEKKQNVKRNVEKERKQNLRKLTYDIIRFGSSGFDAMKKEESKIALAVSLGAKPPKRKARNYVEILAEKKAEKEKAHKFGKQNSSKTVFKKKGTKKRKNKNESKGLLDKYGNVEHKK